MKNKTIALLGVACFVSGAFVARVAEDTLTVATLQEAQKVIGLRFTEAQLDSATSELESFRKDYEVLRRQELPNSVAPALVFNPIPVGYTFETERTPFAAERPQKVTLPKKREELDRKSVV